MRRSIETCHGSDCLDMSSKSSLVLQTQQSSAVVCSHGAASQPREV